MTKHKAFISHSTKDKEFAERLRLNLHDHGVEAWIDHRELLAGGDLNQEIKAAIEQASAFLAVWTLASLNSDWVDKETLWALAVQARNKDYKVIHLLLGNEITTTAVKRVVGNEVKCVQVAHDPGGLQEALGEVLAALGIIPPPVVTFGAAPSAPPVEELVLRLSQAAMVTVEGKERGEAQAKLEYRPAHGGPPVESPPYHFRAPIGPIEAEDLSWYLERYPRWPGKPFRMRAKKVEQNLPQWGRALSVAALGAPEANTARTAWEGAPAANPRRFTVVMDDVLTNNAEPSAAEIARSAAAAHLLGLPWELLHDNSDSFLFQGKTAVRVRRRLPNYGLKAPIVTAPPLRVLMVSPRPDDDVAGYIDHRVTALPMAEALAELGALAELTVLAQPTFPAMLAAIRTAEAAGKPFQVVHFDGHGAYLKDLGLGALCFEATGQEQVFSQRKTELVDAQQLAADLKGYRIPLVFLEACQGGKAEVDPSASVAAKLLEKGVAAVAAMSHSVLVTTAKAFVTVFYQDLVRGARVGEAMLAGQRTLYEDKHRGHCIGAGKLELHDWFVPVLFQEGEDHPLVQTVPSATAKVLIEQGRKASLGALPEPPPHAFVGRSRELLALERLLLVKPFAVLLGEGGEGKTALACEAARWLVQIHRVARVVFVSLETATHARAVLDEVGRQLVGEDSYAVALFENQEKALLPVVQVLQEQPTLIVLDNLETVLPPRAGGVGSAYDPDELALLLTLFQKLGAVEPTKLLFTSREPLPAPFEAEGNHLDIGPLLPWDAVELVKNILLHKKVVLPTGQEGDSEETLLALVGAVHHHARTLALLAPELAQQGVPKTTEALHGLMAGLTHRLPANPTPQQLREQTLFAGVALALHRLPPEVRERLRPLGVFQGGGHLWVIGQVLEIEEPEQLQLLVSQLLETGLCDRHEYGYLTFHFALCPFLWGELGASERATAQQRWLKAEGAFAEFLRQQYSQDPNLAANLALRDLPNLLAGLAQAAQDWLPEPALKWASALATLVETLGKRSAQQQVATIREGLSQKLGAGWSQAHFRAEVNRVDHLAAQGNGSAAREAALALLQRSLSAGVEAYPEAAYDLAMAYVLAGRHTANTGAVASALPLLQEARKRFLRLGAAGSQAARRMAAAALAELGDGYLDLGQLDEAARCYEQAGQELKTEGDSRSVAVSKGQLGTVRMRQQRYPEALAAYAEARATFSQLNEPATVATSWHQTGMVYQRMRAWTQAEEAYRNSIKLESSLHHEAGEAATLLQLGSLFKAQQRWEEAVVAYRQAAEIYLRLQDLAKEGRVCNNLANTLSALQRYGEARAEVQRAIQCKEPFGHAAEPWTSWDTLAKIESAEKNTAAAAQAWQQARALFAAYRRDGGESYQPGAQWCRAVIAALQQGTGASLRQEFEQVGQTPDLPAWAHALLSVLLAILDGDRNPALADTPGLYYADSVEVERLLEQLAALP